MAKWRDKEAAIRSLERNGYIDPGELIDAARDPSHPCCEDFTWDVEKAAKERWWEQACSLIRRCKFRFEVEDVGTPVVAYVASPDYKLHESVQRMKKPSKVSAVLQTEVAMLHGSAARVYGIALSKATIVGGSVVGRLEVIRDTLAELKSELSE